MPVIERLKLKKTSNIIEVRFTNGEVINLETDIVLDSQLAQGDNISHTEIKALLDRNADMSLKKEAYNFISYKPRTEKQVRGKLSQNNPTEDQIQNVIDFLYEFNYLDDKKYALSFIADLPLKKPMGRNKVRSELKSRGVPEPYITSALATFSNEMEQKQLDKLLSKRITEPITSLRRLAKEQRYILSRGFNVQMFLDYLKEYNLLKLDN
ncbi:MAG: hypothetical protein Kapaf2KO_22030 [Candidatus Kapaibacteriales bacterium]